MESPGPRGVWFVEVFRCLEVLLERFKNQLDLPAIFIDRSNGTCREMKNKPCPGYSFPHTLASTSS
jgi:hypothetical protein